LATPDNPVLPSHSGCAWFCVGARGSERTGHNRRVSEGYYGFIHAKGGGLEARKWNLWRSSSSKIGEVAEVPSRLIPVLRTMFLGEIGLTIVVVLLNFIA